ncbi:MAG: hypothetical protein HC784_08400, partial [Hydrococcus sp. CSU_1_8]|nr:hypothetical protein [Hydrococcus sp. CSU_1_8]
MTSDQLDLIGIGFVVSFIVAIIVVKAFVAAITRFGFAPFAWYRITVEIPSDVNGVNPAGSRVWFETNAD